MMSTLTNQGLIARVPSHLRVPVLLVLVLLAAVAVRAPRLFTVDGIGGAIIVAVPLMLAAMALTPIALAGRGGVDLAVGPLIGFINVTMIQWLVGNDIQSPIVVIAFMIAVGVAYQVLQALIIIHVRVSPIIVTLSGYLVLTGLNLVIMPRPSGVAPEWMASWGAGTSIFSPVLLLFVVACVLWYAWKRTVMFTHLCTTGSDERTAYASGVNVDAVRLTAHVAAGVLAGLASLAFTALIGSGDPTQGSTYTLTAVTALVLGGTSLAGGKGGALGSVLGALNMYLISYVLSTFDFGTVSAYVTQMSYGLLLVASLVVTIFTGRRAGAAR
jgi:ribose transport system permease protein